MAGAVTGAEHDHPDLPAVIGAALAWDDLDDDDRAALTRAQPGEMGWADAIAWACASLVGRASPDEIARRAVRAVDRWMDARPVDAVADFVAERARNLRNENLDAAGELALIADVISLHLEVHKNG